MEIINKKIEELKMYDKNPRKNDDSVDYVANSIKQFGFKVPLVIDKDGVIVTGHTRYKASKKLGLKEVPCIIADDLTPEQIKAFRIADNKVTEKSSWDLNLLSRELEELQELNFDISSIGFDELDIDGLIGTNDDIEDNEYEDSKLKGNDVKLHKCPNCGCEFED